MQAKNENRLTHRTIGSIAWSSFGTAGQTITNILVAFILARLLTPVDFGIISAALIVIGFCKIFASLGVGSAIIREPSVSEIQLRTGFTISTMLGLGLATLFFLISPALAALFQLEGLAPVLRALSPIFIMDGLATIAASSLQRDLQFRTLGLIQTLSNAFGYGLVGIVLAFLGFGMWSLVVAQLMQTLIEDALTLLAKPHPKRPALNLKELQKLVGFGSGMTATKLANFVALQGDNFVVGRWLGAEALGLYSRAYRFMAWPANIYGDAVQTVLFPVMSQVQNDMDRLATAYRRGISLMALVLMPLSVLSILLAPELVQGLLGPKWTGVIAPFQILSVGLFFRVAYKLTGSVANAVGAVYDHAWRKTLYAGLVVAAAFVGKQFGIAGVALGVTCTIMVQTLLMFSLGSRRRYLTWKGVSLALAPGLLLSFIEFVALYGLLTMMRQFGLSPIIVILSSCALFFTIFLIAVRGLTLVTLGSDGGWWIGMLSKYGKGFRKGSRIEGLSHESIN